ncbi:uncharacterized protein LOC115759002 isoform X1 [Drosophila novamexicana]|uniref:uncharacterized protein LOC115759002 isoform X1 n=1 Tax=Drosophila novamexicana TaxID=47314 RepID=UPI0011E60796|nr:uncharacterized protein LOC115759002 isoform X1 [Drosophila novamexicana]XP_030555669.1 uncharacterized protein LOC115759002 isoform X1 [Drosophila novamexicana]
MLMPVLEYNKHIAKIPNCKMRSLRACMQQLLLLLLLSGHSDVCRALDIATSNGGGGGGSSTGSGSGSAPGMGAGGSTALSGPPGALNANLTELGSPGVYNSTNGLMLITCRAELFNCLLPDQNRGDAAILAIS